MSAVASAILGLPSLLTISQPCVGSVAVARNGTRDHASIFPTLRLTTRRTDTRATTKADCGEAGQQRYIKVRNIKVEDAMRQLAQAFKACTGSVQLPEQPKLVN
jgi:hypothetical protein